MKLHSSSCSASLLPSLPTVPSAANERTNERASETTQTRRRPKPDQTRPESRRRASARARSRFQIADGPDQASAAYLSSPFCRRPHITTAPRPAQPAPPKTGESYCLALVERCSTGPRPLPLPLLLPLQLPLPSPCCPLLTAHCSLLTAHTHAHALELLLLLLLCAILRC